MLGRKEQKDVMQAMLKCSQIRKDSITESETEANEEDTETTPGIHRRCFLVVANQEDAEEEVCSVALLVASS